MLTRDFGKVKLSSLSAIVLRDFIDRRTEASAGGVTIAADLSLLSAVLKWGRHGRHSSTSPTGRPWRHAATCSTVA